MKRFFLIISLFTAAISWADEKVISVLYFDNTTKNEDYEWLRKGLADMLITDLSSSPRIKVVERENLEKVLKEQQLQLAGVVSDKNAVELGELLQARTLIYGSFVIQGKNIRVDAKITDVESGKIQDSMKVEGSVEDVLGLQQEFAKRVFLQLVLEPMAVGDSPDTENVTAVKNYYEGMDLMDRGKIDEAMKKFKKSSELDPMFIKPQKSMEEAYRFLKDFKKLRYQREIKELYETAAAIKKRLNEKPFRTYADLVMASGYAQLTPEEREAFNKKYVAYYKGDTPVQLGWNYMLTLEEIGDKSKEYFEDEATYKSMLQEMIKVSKMIRKKYPKDSFLPEVIYQELMAQYWLENYKESKAIAEELMLNYPDYRMMWAVEDFYENSLGYLEGKK